MRKVNPDLKVTININTWPFGSKDWEEGLPLRKIYDLGVSQHGHSGTSGMEWLTPAYKSKLTHDLNPNHSDLWRTGRPLFDFNNTPEDIKRFEMDITTALLASLTNGTTPWSSDETIRHPAERPGYPELGVGKRAHEMLLPCEPYFSTNQVCHAGILISQNTHDFYGHIPETDNLYSYRDAVIGTWMLLTENHIIFEFIFDNQLNKKDLEGFNILILPNTAALSNESISVLKEWTEAGGNLILTADTAGYDEWGEKRTVSGLKLLFEAIPTEEKTIAMGNGFAHYLPVDPGLQYARNRDKQQKKNLLRLISQVESLLDVEAPPSLVVNAFYGKEKKELIIHMLNVSPYMPDGDMGFRGIRRPAVKGYKITNEYIPAQNVAIRPKAWTVKSARLIVAGTGIEPDSTGAIVVPNIDIHDTLVIEII